MRRWGGEEALSTGTGARRIEGNEENNSFSVGGSSEQMNADMDATRLLWFVATVARSTRKILPKGLPKEA